MPADNHFPRVTIKFCTKCKWNLRASWYLQELLQTFDNRLGEIALIPFEAGVFRVEIQKNAGSETELLWDRKDQGGFPDSKILKQLVRNAVFPDETLGHVDKANKNDGKLVNETKLEVSDECVECNSFNQ